MEDDVGFVSTLFPTSWNNISIAPVDSAITLKSTVSFADDITGNSFGGVSSVTGLRSRDDIKASSRYNSPAPTKIKDDSKKGGVDKLVRLLRIRPGDIGVSICGGKFGKTGLHTCAASLTFGASCVIKAHIIKVQDLFVDDLYIQTPTKNSKAQKTVYMTLFLPIKDIDHDMIAPLLATERTVAVCSTLLPSLISLSSAECVVLVKSIYLVVETKAVYFIPKKSK